MSAAAVLEEVMTVPPLPLLPVPMSICTVLNWALLASSTVLEFRFSVPAPPLPTTSRGRLDENSVPVPTTLLPTTIEPGGSTVVLPIFHCAPL